MFCSSSSSLNAYCDSKQSLAKTILKHHLLPQAFMIIYLFFQLSLAKFCLPEDGTTNPCPIQERVCAQTRGKVQLEFNDYCQACADLQIYTYEFGECSLTQQNDEIPWISYDRGTITAFVISISLFYLNLIWSLLVPFVGYQSHIIRLTTSTMYLYPDLRYNPKQLGLASQRVYRVVKAGSKMALTYLINSSQPIEEKHLASAIELRDAFQKNAGLYIKFGQILASLDFIIPEQYRKTFEVMCIQNNETPAQMIQQQLKDGYGDPEKIFKKWNPVPISSASIAQVHKAVLMDGREVAVKIQHPWLKEQMEGDIRLIEIFVDVAERIFPGFKYKWLAEELRVNLPKELDFQLEIKNAQKIKYELRNFKDIKIPDIYKEFCNDRIICMEFIYGDSSIGCTFKTFVV
ncbi:hypothetical protein pb186bvf_016144 [Paramecium bursaria]